MQRWLLVLFALAGMAAYAVVLGNWFAFIFVPLVLFLEIRGVTVTTPRLKQVLRWITGLVAAGVGVLPLFVTFQLVYTETAIKIAMPAGGLLCAATAAALWG